MKRLILLAAVAFVACSSDDLTPQQRAVEEEAVGTRLQSWAKAMNNRWIDSIAAAYDHSATMSAAWPDGKRTHGWDEERLAQRAFYESIQFMNLGVQDPRIEILTPTVAITTFRHSTDIIVAGVRQPVTSGLATFVWIKDLTEQNRSQQWKLHTAEWANSEKAAAPAAAPSKAPAKRR